MKMNLLRTLVVCATLATSLSSFAKETIDSLKDKIDDSYRAVLIKERGFYYLKLSSSTSFNKNGEKFGCCSMTNPTVYILSRDVKFPVDIKNLKRDGVNFYKQFGITNEDLARGNFSNTDRMTVADIFSHYEGKSKDLGLVIFGGGYVSSKSSTGLKLSAPTGGFIFPAGGLPFAITGGLRWTEFSFDISTNMRAAKVTYTLGTNLRDSYERSVSEEVVSLDDILAADLIDN